ncbi:2TM domain-containing protein [Methanogenium sp. S4BF]|uniref:2TM domain-containing protein n=1 Tax=Methanogenium sp. S4BF TaxID=1789226 RepID=UPI002416289F|nr:2TM domain-containing protein [Methanogenium sp. S4BF]WFN34129.1 2TM domain-containing protein [Methanogenium sp. S4BF]
MQQERQDGVQPDEPNGGCDDGRGKGMLADPPVRGLVYHAALYMGVVLILIAVNLRIAPDSLWVLWIALLWGVLLIWNAWQVFRPGGRIQR